MSRYGHCNNKATLPYDHQNITNDGPTSCGGKTGATSISSIITVTIQLSAVDGTMGILTVRVIPRRPEDGHNRMYFVLQVVPGASLGTITNIDCASFNPVSWKSVALSIAILNGSVKSNRSRKRKWGWGAKR